MKWGVFKVRDDGARGELVAPTRSEEAASRVAGYMRDRMTDDQVADALRVGWNYMPRPLTREQAAKVHVRNIAPQARAQQRFATPKKRLARKGVQRRT